MPRNFAEIAKVDKLNTKLENMAIGLTLRKDDKRLEIID
jgi:hypothetical protein